jgi:hypothetical protein
MMIIFLGKGKAAPEGAAVLGVHSDISEKRRIVPGS